MAELNDYSGEFKPDLTLDDLSKEFLIKLIKEYQYAWLHLTDAWYYAVKDECGVDTANKCETAAWDRMSKRVNPRYAKIANIKLKTVVDSMKALQLPLDNNRADSLFPQEIKVLDKNHVVLTIRKCRSLDFMEKAAPERIVPVCHVNEPIMFKNYMVNPNVKVTPVKLPPRKSPDEIACVWDISLQT